MDRVDTIPDLDSWVLQAGNDYDLLGLTHPGVAASQTVPPEAHASTRATVLSELSLRVVRTIPSGSGSTYEVVALKATSFSEANVHLFAKFVPSNTPSVESRTLRRVPGALAPLYEVEHVAGCERLEIYRYFNLGSLRERIGSQPFNREQIRELLSQLHRCLTAITAEMPKGGRFVHCDIKPENILVESIVPLKVLLTDFDHACVFDELSPPIAPSSFTLGYVPPEVVVGGGHLSPKTDYWSIGIMMHELLTGKHVFSGVEDARLRNLLGTTWNGATAGFRNEIEDEDWLALLYGLVDRDPATRWDVEKLGRWLNNDPQVIAEGLQRGIDPAASSPCPIYPVFGKNAMARALIANWNKGITSMRNAEFRDWVANDLKDSQLVSRLDSLLSKDIPDDEMLVRFAYFANPLMPPQWKGIPLNAFELDQRAAAALEGEMSACDELVKLRNDAEILVRAFDDVGIHAPREILRHWPTSWQRYQEGWQRLVEAGAPDQRPDERAAFPALVRLWISDKARKELSDNILSRSSALNCIMRRDWYFALGNDICGLPVEHQWILQNLDQSSLVDTLMYSYQRARFAGLDMAEPLEVTDEQLHDSVLCAEITEHLTRKLMPDYRSRRMQTLAGNEHIDDRPRIFEDDGFAVRMTAPVGRWLRNRWQLLREWMQRRLRRMQTEASTVTEPVGPVVDGITVDLVLAPPRGDAAESDTASVRLGQAVLLRWELPEGVSPVIHIGNTGWFSRRVRRQRIVRLPLRRRTDRNMSALERWVRRANGTKLPNRGQMALAFFQPTIVWLSFRTPRSWRATRTQAIRVGTPDIWMNNADYRLREAETLMPARPSLNMADARFIEARTELEPALSSLAPVRTELLLPTQLMPFTSIHMQRVAPELPHPYYHYSSPRVDAINRLFSIVQHKLTHPRQ